MFHHHRNVLRTGSAALLILLMLTLHGHAFRGKELTQRRLGAPGRAARGEEGRPAGGLFAPRSVLEDGRPAGGILGRNRMGGENSQMPTPAADGAARSEDTPSQPRRLFQSARERQNTLRERMNQENQTPKAAASESTSGNALRSMYERPAPRVTRPKNPNVPVPPQKSGTAVFGRSILDAQPGTMKTDEKKLSEMSGDEIMKFMESDDSPDVDADGNADEE